jgi:hypothetical protein
MGPAAAPHYMAPALPAHVLDLAVEIYPSHVHQHSFRERPADLNEPTVTRLQIQQAISGDHPPFGLAGKIRVASGDRHRGEAITAAKADLCSHLIMSRVDYRRETSVSDAD